MTGDVHDVIDTAEQPKVTVLISFGAVTGKIFAGKSAPEITTAAFEKIWCAAGDSNSGPAD